MDVNKLMPLAIAGGLLWAAYKFAPNSAVKTAVLGVAAKQIAIRERLGVIMSVGKLLRLGLPFSNVVASGVATALVTPGRTMHRLRAYGASQRQTAIDKNFFAMRA